MVNHLVCNLFLWEGLDIAGHNNAIVLPLDGQGRSTGDAYVEFQSERGQLGALEKHRNKIGHRWVKEGSLKLGFPLTLVGLLMFAAFHLL